MSAFDTIMEQDRNLMDDKGDFLPINEERKKEILKILLDEPLAKDKVELIRFAAERKNLEYLDFFLEIGFDPSVRGENNQTTCEIAINQYLPISKNREDQKISEALNEEKNPHKKILLSILKSDLIALEEGNKEELIKNIESGEITVGELRSAVFKTKTMQEYKTELQKDRDEAISAGNMSYEEYKLNRKEISRIEQEQGNTNSSTYFPKTKTTTTQETQKSEEEQSPNNEAEQSQKKDNTKKTVRGAVANLFGYGSSKKQGVDLEQAAEMKPKSKPQVRPKKIQTQTIHVKPPSGKGNSA